MPTELGTNEWMMIWGGILALLAVIIMWRVFALRSSRRGIR
jgi:hypothetical protein